MYEEYGANSGVLMGQDGCYHMHEDHSSAGACYDEASQAIEQKVEQSSHLVVGARIEAQWGDLWYPGYLLEIFEDGVMAKIQFDEFPEEIMNLAYVRNYDCQNEDYDEAGNLKWPQTSRTDVYYGGYQDEQSHYNDVQYYQSYQNQHDTSTPVHEFELYPYNDIGLSSGLDDAHQTSKLAQLKKLASSRAMCNILYFLTFIIVVCSVSLALQMFQSSFSKHSVDILTDDDGSVYTSLDDMGIGDDDGSTLRDDSIPAMTNFDIKPHVIMIVADDMAWNSIGI